MHTRGLPLTTSETLAAVHATLPPGRKRCLSRRALLQTLSPSRRGYNEVQGDEEEEENAKVPMDKGDKKD